MGILDKFRGTDTPSQLTFPRKGFADVKILSFVILIGALTCERAQAPHYPIQSQNPDVVTPLEIEESSKKTVTTTKETLKATGYKYKIHMTYKVIEQDGQWHVRHMARMNIEGTQLAIYFEANDVTQAETQELAELFKAAILSFWSEGIKTYKANSYLSLCMMDKEQTVRTCMQEVWETKKLSEKGTISCDSSGWVDLNIESFAFRD